MKNHEIVLFFLPPTVPNLKSLSTLQKKECVFAKACYCCNLILWRSWKGHYYSSHMSSQPREEVLSQYETKWTQEQTQLKQKKAAIVQKQNNIKKNIKRLIMKDDFDFELPQLDGNKTSVDESKTLDLLTKPKSPLRYIGGVDISHGEKDEDIACAGYVDNSPIVTFIKKQKKKEKKFLKNFLKKILVVLEYPSLKEVYRRFNIVRYAQPYIPGFLAFREVEFLVQIINEMKQECSEYMPQIILVDGNGILHQRGFGLACHLGVLVNIPTIGVAKNLLVVDGLDQKVFKKQWAEFLTKDKAATVSTGIMDIIGPISKQTWGVAMLCSLFGREYLHKRQQKSANDAKNPAFISIGHRVSLRTAVEVVKLTCRGVKLPDPIRYADHGTREAIQKYEQELAKKNIATTTTK
ncbi:endonuclease V [Reticulomyxa filosa]|uniref:Endonuclease V n=1 Tax=Reticulomyxa filosa TaxID=46433 RepID=X6NIW6_RETFI|nr:endonuclease V [Reticulomyxa filosa]|eukprot:ETO25292.1 endonuclease V [Reticulomyxa filosa]